MSEDTIRGFTALQQRIIDLIETGCVEQRFLIPNIELDVICNSEQKKRIVELERQVNQMALEIKSAGTDAALAKNTAQRMEARLNERRR